MNRLMSYATTVAFIVGGYFAYTLGLPAFENWKIKAIAEAACKDNALRVEKGMDLNTAQREVSEQFVARVADRGNVVLDNTMYEVVIWQGFCTIKVTLKDGTRIQAKTVFPEEQP